MVSKYRIKKCSGLENEIQNRGAYHVCRLLELTKCLKNNGEVKTSKLCKKIDKSLDIIQGYHYGQGRNEEKIIRTIPKFKDWYR